MSNNKYYNESTIEALVAFCHEYCNVYDEFVTDVKSQTLSLPQQVIAADMLKRSRVIVESLYYIFPILRKHPNHKMSIFLLLRSQISDIFSYLSFLTFIAEEDPTELAIRNESDLLDSDFLKAILTLHEENKRLLETNGISQIVSSNDDARNAAVKEELLENYKHLLNEKNEVKSTKEIRNTTDSKHFSKDPDKMKKSLSNEKDKFERIMMYAPQGTKEQIAPLYSIFKYFSQFQHYSRGSMFFFKHKHLDYDVFNILIAVTSIYVVSELQYRKLLGGPNQYSERLKGVDAILVKIIQQ